MATKKHQKHRHLPAFILLMLAEDPAHGGAIYNALIEKLPNFECDTGAIYRTLQQLEKGGAVTFSWDTTNSGPARKIYSITDEGLIELDDWKKDIEDKIIYLKYFLNEYNDLKR